MANRHRKTIRLFVGITLVSLIVASFYFFSWIKTLENAIEDRMADQQWALPARVYARPMTLAAGLPVTLPALLRELRWLGYSESEAAKPGHYQRNGDKLVVQTRGFAFSDGYELPQRAHLTFNGNILQELRDEQGQKIDIMRLEPLELGAIHPGKHEDRLLVAQQDYPPGFVDTLLAIEDRKFFDHSGISVTGILRAIWVNIKSGSKRQGCQHADATTGQKPFSKQREILATEDHRSVYGAATGTPLCKRSDSGNFH